MRADGRELVGSGRRPARPLNVLIRGRPGHVWPRPWVVVIRSDASASAGAPARNCGKRPRGAMLL